MGSHFNKPEEENDLEGDLLNDFLTKLLTSDAQLDADFKAIMLDYFERCSTDGPILD